MITSAASSVPSSKRIPVGVSDLISTPLRMPISPSMIRSEAPTSMY
jgi:hypothetical protein